MARYDNTFEGGVDGAAITVANSAGASGTAWGAIVANGVGVTSSSNITYSSAAAKSGSLGGRMVLDAGSSYLRLDASAALGTRVFFSLKTTYPGPASTSTNTVAVLMATSTRVLSLLVGTDGKPFFGLTNSGTWYTACKPSTALTAGSTYIFQVVVGTASSAGATDGELGFRILDAGGTVVHSWTGTGDTGVAAYTAARFGGANNVNGWTTFDIDDVSLGDSASGWPTLLSSTATTVNVTGASYYAVDFRASTSGGNNVLSFSIAWTGGPNYSTSIQTPVAGLFLVPQDTSTVSVYTVTIVDGAATNTRQVSVPAAAASSSTDSVTEYYWDGSAWV